jgi:retinol dehydrogenase 12
VRDPRVCSQHPGTVHTEVTRNFSALVKFGYWISQPLMRIVEKSPAEGAYTTVHVATAPELQGIGGKYFVHCADVPMPAAAEHIEQCEELWELSQSITAKAIR